MENLQPEAAAASGGIVAPKNAIPQYAQALVRPPFTAAKSECVAAPLMYALAYVYVRMYLALLEDTGSAVPRVLLAVFTLGFLALGESLHRDTPRKRESWVWLGCTALILVSILVQRGNAWDEGLPFVFLHIFAVWWALSRSDTLLEGESGRMLPLDALDGFVAFPFKHFFLRARTAWFATSALLGGRKREKGDAGALAWTALIAAAALGLLALAANLLMSADAGFASLLEGVVELFRFDWDFDFLGEVLLRFLLSLPVGAYLFGLLAGTRREEKGALRKRVSAVDETLEMLRGVPERVWLVLLALFGALYALFFAVQGRYLFGAFTRTLPDGFVVAEYARQGFFELCKVMAVNFALLWLVTRTSKKGVRGQRAALALCLVLLAESLLLAVVALSKLWLYIDCFGFTPRRLQSTWLVCVLAFGTLCAMWSLVKNAKTFRVWMVFGAATLSLLCLY
ncbi:MAG: DUF4173 domain-containing protein [Ruminococcaceae bacterium]|nr:DUF4173 domain-containing protein [Oscillospiraceae bacterium]